MRFRLLLASKIAGAIIPINYQYPLSAAIYRILAKADTEYATFLHEKGYAVGEGFKHFKLFTFSDLRTKFKLRGDRMYLSSDLELIVSFHLPEAAQHFVKGLFLSQNMDIADKKSKATFIVRMVEAMPDPFGQTNIDKSICVDLRPISPCVAGIKNNKGDYDFISPVDARFPLAIKHNWEQKLKALGMPYNEEELQVRVNLLKTAPKSRLVVIKAGTKAQTRIRGFMNFGLQLEGNKKNIEVLCNAGAGIYNAQGMGCMEVDIIKNK
ncbi:MAG: CRISPR-associated endoribonuclease Cas6 [Flavobacteriaceae bacterium]